MKQILRCAFILTYVIFFTIKLYSQEIPLDSLYLGQTPPGITPKIFSLSVSPGFFAAERITISNDGKEIYYSELDGYFHLARIKYYNYSGGKWNGPVILFENYFSPALSVGGDTMYFQSVTNPQHEIWCSVKSNTGWSAPSRFMSNQPLDYMLWETNTGNFYFGSYTAKGGLGSRDWSNLIISGNDTTVQSLGVPLCTSGNDVDFCVSRNENYFISANSNFNFCISYHKPDGNWTNPKKLISALGWAPCITPDNKFLFYSTGSGVPSNNDTWIYWVRVDNMIDSLKNINFIPYLKNRIPNQTTTQDSLFNYHVPDSTFIDDDGNNTLRYSATLSNGNPLPVWLSLDSVTCVFSGTSTTATALTIKVTATDTANASASCIFTITFVLGPTGIGENKNHVPVNFALQQNYPNPFNPSTIIRYSLSKSSQVKLTVYNLLGQNMKTLVDSYQSAGEHSLTWDAMDKNNNQVSSGVYFYTLETENVTFQKKMILIR